MKKTILTLTAMMLLAACNTVAQDITLPKPNLNREVTLMKALSNRASARECSPKEILLQDLGDLLWAANGINRPAEMKRTAPSAVNAQDIDIYVVMEKAAYKYDAENHKLVEISKGDHRGAVAAGQEFVNSFPVSLVLVSNLAKFGDKKERTKQMGYADGGYVSQNIDLFCSAFGLVTVPRATMDDAKLRAALNLTDMQLPVLNNPVGYSK